MAEPDTPSAFSAADGLPALKAPRSTWRVVLSLAWPVLVQQFLVFAVGLSDRFLGGHFEPPDPSQHVAYQAAQTNAQYMSWVFTSFSVLVTAGSTALVARFVGARDQQLAVRATNQSILLAVVLGIAGAVGGLIFLDQIVALVQLRGEAAQYAAVYLRPLFLLLPFQVVELTGIACLVGAGDTRPGLYILGGVALLNLPFAWAFCWGCGPVPALGFEGIALGTALSHLIGGSVVLIMLARGRAGLRLQLGLLWPDGRLLWRLLRVSVPAGLDSLSVVAGQLWFLGIVNRLGNDATTAHGIALGWESMAYLPGSAFGTAAMALVGQNLGARRPLQAARSGWLAFGYGCGFMCLMGLVFYVFAPEMFAIFCPNPEQQSAIALGVPVLRLVAFAMPALASSVIFTSALRGAGDTRVPVLFTWVGFLGVRIPLAYLLTAETLNLGGLGTWTGPGLGLRGAWLAMFADLLVRGTFFLRRFASGRWQGVQV